MATGNRLQGGYLGDREEGGRLVPTYILLPDRELHTCIIGAPGQGMSVLLLGIIIGDISRGEAHEFESAKDQISSKWADPSDDCYSRETAAEDRRAAILETMYGNGDGDT
jgi:hypothetical protein